MAAPIKTDWEGVEREYRAGQLSLSEIGLQYGITKGRICQVAKAKKWDRDLSIRIKVKAEAKLNDALLNENLNAKQKEFSDTERVEAGAEAVTRIVLSHRTAAAALREKARLYRMELDQCGDDLAKRVSILKMLADIEKQVITIEREAFGLKNEMPEDEKVKVLKIELVAPK